MSQPNFERLLDSSEVEVNIGELTCIGKGFSSKVYANAEHVVKLLRRPFSTNFAACTYVNNLIQEQEGIADFLGPSRMAMARFVVGQSHGLYRLSLVQTNKGGVSLQTALDLSGDADTALEYLEVGLQMYERKGEIPDFTCMEGSWFNDALTNPNTQAIETPDGYMPVLVDTLYGNFQRSSVTGSFFHRQIAEGVRRTMGALE